VIIRCTEFLIVIEKSGKNYSACSPAFPDTPGKSGPHIRVLFAFICKNHLWQSTGKEAAGPLFGAILQGAFQPIFAKIPIIWAIFPREQNPGPICCPQWESGIQKMETEPCTGLFRHGGMMKSGGARTGERPRTGNFRFPKLRVIWPGTGRRVTDPSAP